MDTKELREIAKTMKIKAYSKLNKIQLEDILAGNQKEIDQCEAEGKPAPKIGERYSDLKYSTYRRPSIKKQVAVKSESEEPKETDEHEPEPEEPVKAKRTNVTGWTQFVNEFRSHHEGMSYKDAMTAAAKPWAQHKAKLAAAKKA